MDDNLCRLDVGAPHIEHALQHDPHTVQFFCNTDEGSFRRKDGTVIPTNTNCRNPLLTPRHQFLPPVHGIPYKAPSPPRRVLDGTAPRLPYSAKAQQTRTTLHWGQRKLHLTEVEFFLEKLSPEKSYVVVYAGAAPGTHMVMLRRMFKRIKFHLVDPAPFDPKLEGLPRVTLHKETYFTDDLARELAQRYRGKRLVFISDIRLDPAEDSIRRDMESQEQWVNIMRPRHSRLTFRLPWDMDRYTYLEGEVRLQPFPPLRSTETRLLVDRQEKRGTFPQKEYDTRLYEDQCFYHNVVSRGQYYSHPYQVPYMDHCYDCMVEFEITRRYLESGFNKTGSSLTEMVQELTKALGQNNKLKQGWEAMMIKK